MLELQAKVREGKGGAAELVARGEMPAVVYGPKVESVALTLDHTWFEKVLRDAGESTVIKLTGLDEDHEVLIQDVAYDPVKGHVLHADLYAVERGKKIDVTVELVFEGESPAVKNGEQLVRALYEVDVRATPGNLPHNISVDISTLADVGDKITVGDLVVSDEVEILQDPEDPVALIQEPEEEPEEEESTEIDMDAIEVEEKGKGEDADEEASEEKES